MASQPASGYYHFTIAVTGDSRLVANHVEVRWCFNSKYELFPVVNFDSMIHITLCSLTCS